MPAGTAVGATSRRAKRAGYREAAVAAGHEGTDELLSRRALCDVRRGAHSDLQPRIGFVRVREFHADGAPGEPWLRCDCVAARRATRRVPGASKDATSGRERGAGKPATK